MSDNKTQYEAVEAFCIMTYQCTECKKTEELYNNRDGVTPFGIGCRYCGSISNHINWKNDIQDENFKPCKGMRIFEDYTPERAKEAVIKRIAQFKGTEYEIKQGTERYNDMVRGMTEEYVNDCCSVDIVERA